MSDRASTKASTVGISVCLSVLAALLLAVGLAACEVVGPDPTADDLIEPRDAPEPRDTPEPPDTTEWARFDARGIFSFEGPIDLVDQEVQGIDSFVGLYRNASIIVHFDYGPYTSPETECHVSYLTCRFQNVLFGNRPGRLFDVRLASRDEELGRLIYLSFADIDDVEDDGIRLSFGAYSYVGADTTYLNRIARSVSFGD